MKTTLIEKDGNLFVNDKLVGRCYMEVDGYYVFVPLTEGGFWDEFSLRFIADFLEEKNKEWNKRLEKYFNEKESEDTNL